MNNEEMENRIKNNVREYIALSNIKNEISINRMKTKRRFYTILPSCSALAICSVILINCYDKSQIKDAKIQQQTSYNQNEIKDDVDSTTSDIYQEKVEEERKKTTNLTISEVQQKVAKNKIFYYDEGSAVSCLEYEPNIENLYKYSDIVVTGKYDLDLSTYADGLMIWTETKFNVSKIIKNTTNLDVSKTVVFRRSGGVLSLDKYMKNNPTVSEYEFRDIKVNDRKNYYIIQSYGPMNKLDFTKTKGESNEYMLFLCLSDNQLGLNTGYYGMREIQNNKLYDYNTKTYVEINQDIIKY